MDPGMRGQEGYTGTRDSEGADEAVHIPTGVAYVTEKHFFLVKATLTHLALCILGGGAGKGGGEGQYGPERG